MPPISLKWGFSFLEGSWKSQEIKPLSATIALLAATSAGSFLAAMATASKIGSIVYGILGIIYGGATLASFAAWFDEATYDYFDAFRAKLELGTDRIYRLATQSLCSR